MKIERTDESFKPIELKITIESKEELEMLYCMSGHELSIPDEMYGRENKHLPHWVLANKFLDSLYNLLSKVDSN